MHPAYSVILFTAASGAGYGLLALLGLTGFSHGQTSSFWFGLTALIVALGLITLGLLSSTLHLGRPERAWRAISQWRSSWLSREGIASLVTYGPALVFAAAWLGLLESPTLVALAGGATFLASAITVYCTGKIYSTLPTIRAWANPLTVPAYLAFALATGAPLLMAIAALYQRWQPFQAYLAAAALALTLALKILYWRSIDAAPRTHTIEAATGLGRIGAVRQWEPPHTGENFVMKEMGYQVARKHALRLRVIAAALLALACALSLLTLAAPYAVICILPALSACGGALVERWLFFAEAEHVSMLYYGAKSA